LDVGVTDAVAHKRPLAGQFAPPRHWQTSFDTLPPARTGITRSLGFLGRRTYSGRARQRQGRGASRIVGFPAIDEPRNGPENQGGTSRFAHQAGSVWHHRFDLIANERGRMASTRIAILIAALVLAPGAAGAQVRLDARYVVTLAGVTIGKGAW